MSESEVRYTRKLVNATKIFMGKEDCLFFESFLRQCSISSNAVGQVDLYYGKNDTLLGLVRTNDDGFPVEVELILP